MARFLRTSVLALIFVSSGCTWVPLSQEAEQIRVAPNAQAVTSCKPMGAVVTQTKSSVGIVSRNTEKVSEELLNLAKNEAVEMGANVVRAEGPPTIDGRQRFQAYQCPTF